MNTISERRLDIINRYLEANNNPVEDPYDIKHSRINQARLILNKDIEQANRYFEMVALDKRPMIWPDGTSADKDWDFMGIDLLRTLLDFSKSGKLSEKARANLRSVFTNWEQPRKEHFKDSDRMARYPVIYTENHDLLCLTIGYFGEVFAGRDTRNHETQLARSLSWRFHRGWSEWHSPCYQVIYLNALLILADHAPNAIIRKSASDLVNIQLAERAALSIRGYLGGPYCRGYDTHISNDRNDSYLSVMWMAFGLPDKADAIPYDGIHFASSGFMPHPEVLRLSEMPAKTASAFHRGTRDCSTRQGVSRQMICYYNTPHISMGALRIFGCAHQPRFFNVMFAAEPSKSLRTYLRHSGTPNPWYPRNERGELCQHQNWLIARGDLVEENKLSPEKVGPFNIYRVDKGLCAHVALEPDLHVFQVGDLDQYADVPLFVNSLSLPVIESGYELKMVRALTTNKDNLEVNLADMSLSINGQPEHDWLDKLYTGPSLFSDWDSGRIEIKTGPTSGCVFSDEALRPLVSGMI